MLLHTIIDLNDVFYEQEKPSESNCLKSVGNLHIEGEKSEQGFMIKRVISTNPKDYLDEKYNLGSYINSN